MGLTPEAFALDLLCFSHYDGEGIVDRSALQNLRLGSYSEL